MELYWKQWETWPPQPPPQIVEQRVPDTIFNPGICPSTSTPFVRNQGQNLLLIPPFKNLQADNLSPIAAGNKAPARKHLVFSEQNSQNNSNYNLELQDTFDNLIRKGLNQDKREQVQGSQVQGNQVQDQGQGNQLNQTQVLDHLDESQINKTAPSVMGQLAPNLSLDSEIQFMIPQLDRNQDLNITDTLLETARKTPLPLTPGPPIPGPRGSSEHGPPIPGLELPFSSTPPEFLRGYVLVQTSWTNLNITRTGLSPLDFL